MKGKTCNRCKKHYKTVEGNFYVRKEYKGGYDSKCIECRKEVAKEYYNSKITHRICRVCRIEKPIEEFEKTKRGHKVTCKECRAEGKKKLSQEKRIKRQLEKEKERLKKESDKEIERIYKRLISEPQDKGIGDKKFDLILKVGQVYKITKKGLRENQVRVNETFVGKFIQETEDCIFFQGEDYLESFLKKDYLLGEIEIREVQG